MERFTKDFKNYHINCMGEGQVLDLPMVCVTGTRRATPYGLALARICGEAVAEAGLTLLMTAALGCSVEAARAASKSGGDVVVVTATGVDVPYPHASEDIFDAAKCVVSLESDGTPAMRHAFPRRNELIASMATVTIVCEAGLRSGTTDAALKCESVWAFPGSVLSRASDGTNMLIRNGARAILGENDLRDMLTDHFALPNGTFGMPTDAYEQKDDVMRSLTATPMTTQELVDAMGLDPLHVLRTLARYEADGMVVRMPDGRYAAHMMRKVIG